jgi:hypothetical protein
MLLSKVKMAQETVEKQRAVPMVIGPLTVARLAKLTDIDVPSFVQKLVPVYEELLAKLAALEVRSSLP